MTPLTLDTTGDVVMTSAEPPSQQSVQQAKLVYKVAKRSIEELSGGSSPPSAKKARVEAPTREVMKAALASFENEEGKRWIELAERVTEGTLAWQALHDLLYAPEPGVNLPSDPQFKATLQFLYSLLVTGSKRFEDKAHAQVLVIGLTLELDVTLFMGLLDNNQRNACLKAYLKILFDESFAYWGFSAWRDLVPHLSACDFAVVVEGFDRMAALFEKAENKDVFRLEIMTSAKRWIDDEKMGPNDALRLAISLGKFDLFFPALIKKFKPLQQRMFLNDFLRTPTLGRWERVNDYADWAPSSLLFLFTTAAKLEPKPPLEKLKRVQRAIMKVADQLSSDQLSSLLEYSLQHGLASTYFMSWYSVHVKKPRD